MRDEWTPEIARHYAETYGVHASHPHAVRLARLQPDDVVVDIGCGPGNVLHLAGKVVTHGKLIGVDPSDEMIRIARERSVGHPAAERLQWEVAPAHALPVDDAAATVLLAIHSLHHWDDIGEGFDEVCRVLAPGGRLLIAFEEHYGTFSSDLVAEMLDDLGFRDIDTRVVEVDEDEPVQFIWGTWPGRRQR